jgi:hypothetical protein
MDPEGFTYSRRKNGNYKHGNERDAANHPRNHP